MADCESWNLTLSAIESILAGRPVFPQKDRLVPQIHVTPSRDQKQQSLVKKSFNNSELQGAQQLQQRTGALHDAVGGAAAAADTHKQGQHCHQRPKSASASALTASVSLEEPHTSRKAHHGSQLKDLSSVTEVCVAATYTSSPLIQHVTPHFFSTSNTKLDIFTESYPFVRLGGAVGGNLWLVLLLLLLLLLLFSGIFMNNSTLRVVFSRHLQPRCRRHFTWQGRRGRQRKGQRRQFKWCEVRGNAAVKSRRCVDFGITLFAFHSLLLLRSTAQDPTEITSIEIFRVIAENHNLFVRHIVTKL
jgi:hypothetical protein